MGERPCREWWAVLGTVTEALDGLGSCGLETAGAGAGAEADDGPEAFAACAALSFLKYEGGKCFALYVSWTLESSCHTSEEVPSPYRIKHTLNAFLYRSTLSPKLP